MDKQIFFQSSMPRAGSTLLQNIIGQNPNFHVTPTSGVASLIIGSATSFHSEDDFKKEKDYNLCKNSFYNFCREGIQGYYSNVNKKFVLDKSRHWLYYYSIVNNIFPSPKIICLIRDLRSIFTSYEKHYLKDFNYSIQLSKKLNLPPNSTIYDRIKVYQNDAALRNALQSLTDVNHFKNKHNIKIVKFEDLCTTPQKILDDIYNYLEIPSFTHNFNHIDQITYENDNFHYFGNHDIAPTLKPPVSEWEQYLTPEVSNYLYEEYLGYFQTFNYKK